MAPRGETEAILLSRRKSVYTIGSDDDWHNAARFVGALCLMEFFVAFVTYGAATWEEAGSTWGFSVVEWSALPLFCSSALMYLCGRSLSRGGRLQTVFLWVGIGGFLTAAVLSGVAEALKFYESYEFYSMIGYGVVVGSAIVDAALMGMLLASPFVNLLLLLVLLIWTKRIRRGFVNNDRAFWVICAGVYCIAHIAPTFLPYHYIRSAFEGGGGLFGTALMPPMSSAVVYSVLLVSLATLLYCKRGSARILALFVMAINIPVLWFNWYSMWSLVQSSIETLAHSVPLTSNVDMPFFVFKHDLYWLGIAPVRYVLPWVLIAWYAWRVPMLRPTEDEAPFPQRFCGACHYNLHGIETDRCPECGSDLGLQAHIESTG